MIGSAVMTAAKTIRTGQSPTISASERRPTSASPATSRRSSKGSATLNVRAITQIHFQPVLSMGPTICQDAAICTSAAEIMHTGLVSM
jgi:hypothetical protein